MTSNPAPLPEILNAREVAALLRCSDQQVYNQAQRGQLPCFRIGKLLRFERSAILHFINSQTTTKDWTIT